MIRPCLFIAFDRLTSPPSAFFQQTLPNVSPKSFSHPPSLRLSAAPNIVDPVVQMSSTTMSFEGSSTSARIWNFCFMFLARSRRLSLRWSKLFGRSNTDSDRRCAYLATSSAIFSMWSKPRLFRASAVAGMKVMKVWSDFALFASSIQSGLMYLLIVLAIRGASLCSS